MRALHSWFRALLFGLAAAVCTTGVGLVASPPSWAETDAPPRGLARILRTGELRVGMSGEQPPLNMEAKNGELFGMEVALIRVLSQSIGVQPVIVRRPFGQLLSALDKGEVDLVMSGMTITPTRIQRVAFVGPYYTSGKTILTKSPELAEATVPEDLDANTLTVVALEGSTSEDFAKRLLSQSELVLTETQDEAIQKVLSGEADLMVADRETCAFAVLRHPDAGLIASETPFTVEPMGIALPLDEEKLANLLEAYLKSLRESGALARARDYWFENESWVKDLK